MIITDYSNTKKQAKKNALIWTTKSVGDVRSHTSTIRKHARTLMMSLHGKKALLQTFAFGEHKTLKHPSGQLK